jgi:hypothetical protein
VEQLLTSPPRITEMSKKICSRCQPYVRFLVYSGFKFQNIKVKFWSIKRFLEITNENIISDVEYRWPISTRPASLAQSPLFGPDPSLARSGSMRVRPGPARISGSVSDRKLGMVG